MYRITVVNNIEDRIAALQINEDDPPRSRFWSLGHEVEPPHTSRDQGIIRLQERIDAKNVIMTRELSVLGKCYNYLLLKGV